MESGENNMDDRLLTKERLAKRLGGDFTVAKIDRFRRAGRIPAVRLGYRTFLFNYESVIAALLRHEIKDKPATSKQRRGFISALAKSKREGSRKVVAR